MHANFFVPFCSFLLTACVEKQIFSTNSIGWNFTHAVTAFYEVIRRKLKKFNATSYKSFLQARYIIFSIHTHYGFHDLLCLEDEALHMVSPCHHETTTGIHYTRATIRCRELFFINKAEKNYQNLGGK